MSSETEHLHRFDALFARALRDSRKPFNARGRAVQRCAKCRLSASVCICAHCRGMSADVDFVLLMHRDEIFKPTNTGRLLACVFPDHTFAFEWSRTEPEGALLDLLASPGRRCALLYPPSPERADPVLNVSPVLCQKSPRLTLIIPDGTWRQAGRMVRFSDYLKSLPRLQLPPATSQYHARMARHKGQLATAEAAVQILEQLSCGVQAQRLRKVFEVFNVAAAKMRGR